VTGFQIAALVILVLIVVPLPLFWLIGTLFPNGYTREHTRRISGLFRKEWKRVLLCGVVIALVFIFARENALQVTLLGAAILLGRFIAVSRGG